MKKSLIIMILLAVVSTVIYAGGGGKKSSFGKWDYDKFGEGSVKITNAEASQISNSQDPCRQYVHVSSKFHVRVKNWFQAVQIGRSGYAEMRATLGNATQSCGIPYNIARMDIYYDYTKHVTSVNQSYLKATMKGIGAVNECYKAIGYAFTNSAIVLPSNYNGGISVRSTNDVITGIPSRGNTVSGTQQVNLENIPIDQISFLNPPPAYYNNRQGLTYGDLITGLTTIDTSGIPYANRMIPTGWFLPGPVGTNYAVSIKPYAGAILNEEKGCYNINFGRASFSF